MNEGKRLFIFKHFHLLTIGVKDKMIHCKKEDSSDNDNYISPICGNKKKYENEERKLPH